MNTIAIVDYGMGNFHSVARALQAAAPDADVRICRSAAEITAASRVVFPGQGAMPDCMRTLNESGLRDAVLQAARTKPLLGVCVGEQMLFSTSEEGDSPCLNLFSGSVKKFQGPQFASSRQHGDEAHELLKVPHMGWNSLILKTPSPLLTKAADGYVYFVHSFHAVPEDKGIITAVCDYGTEVTAAVGRGNVQAVQFHPEKSSKVGLGILQSFKEWQL